MRNLKLNILKSVSIISFLVIAKNGDHVIVPIGFTLVISLLYILVELKTILILLIAIVGVFLTSFIKSNNAILIILGYIFTYVCLMEIFKTKIYTITLVRKYISLQYLYLFCFICICNNKIFKKTKSLLNKRD